MSRTVLDELFAGGEVYVITSVRATEVEASFPGRTCHHPRGGAEFRP
ncbi:hypothetical protein ACIRFF_03660 [Streptomyces cyaneofuscatus]